MGIFDHFRTEKCVRDFKHNTKNDTVSMLIIDTGSNELAKRLERSMKKAVTIMINSC